MKKKIALITGITGQDGSYLAEFLLNKKYIVHGVIRRSSTSNTSRINHLIENKKLINSLFLHYSDSTDQSSISEIIINSKPDEIYNLAAQSDVAISFNQPYYTAQVDAMGTLFILETIKNHFKNKKIKFYQASTSELYGKVIAIPQNEKTAFYPRSPYAVAKLYSYWITINYREAFNIFGCNGILFNHESPRRGKNFITRKITYNLSKIYFGLINFFEVGNLDAQRDWGHAKDFVEMQWLMLQQKKASDYVISTEKVFSVRQFITMAAKEMGIQIEFKGKDLKEYGFVKNIFKQKDINCKIKIGQRIVKINKKFYRPTEVNILKGSSKKAKKELNWKPKISFKDMIKEMIDSDMQLIKNKIK